MKIIKPQCLSLLTRPFEFRREFWLGISAIAFMPVGEEAALLPETLLWPFLAEELPPDQPLDAAIPKQQPEILAIAHAYVPGGVPAQSVTTGIQCGALVKMLEVYGDRVAEGRHVGEAALFTQMKLEWSRAFGAKGFADNPLGKGAEPLEPGGRHHPVPNILYPPVDGISPPIPAGYGPVDQSWPQRAKRAGTYDDAWLQNDFPGFARDIDWRFFNLAPEDQYFKQPLQGNERYAFKNLHPEKPLLQGCLPGLKPRLFLVRQDMPDGFEEAALALTTIWCFPHRERLVLIYHGRARLAQEDGSDIARIVLGADAPNAPRGADHYRSIMTLRADPKEGAMYALRDADLAPADWIRPDPALQPKQDSPLKTLFARQRARIEAQYAEAVAKAQAPGQAAFVPPPLPPPREPPTLEEMPAFIAQMKQEMAEKKAEAEALLAQKKQELAAQMRAANMPEEEIEKKLAAKAKGPPPFSAAAFRTELQGQINARRVLGQLTMDLEAQLASPGFAAQLQKAEDGVRNGYRMAAHLQDAADPAPAARAASIRALVQQDSPAAKAMYDLQGANLSGLDLSGIDLSGVCLDGADLSGTNLSGAKLKDAVLAHANLQGCVLDGADLSGANLGRTNLSGAMLRRASLKKSILAHADLRKADFTGADLEGANLDQAILAGANFAQVNAMNLLAMKLSLRGLQAPGICLDKARFLECDLTGVDFSGASLVRAVFLDCRLNAARLAGAKMQNAVFVKQCSLAHAELSNAALNNANLRETKLPYAVLNGADLRNADFSGADLTSAQLANVRGDSARFTAALLQRVDLRRGCFAEADFARADLRGADFSFASLYAANLARARLDEETSTGGVMRARMRHLPLYTPPAP